MKDTNDAGEDLICRMVCVHGIIVADDCYGDVYMIPLIDIMNDTKQALNATSISLPHDTHAVTRLIQTQCFDVQTAADALVSARTSVVPTASGPERKRKLSMTLTEEAIVSTTSPPPPRSTVSMGKNNVWYCSECGDGPYGEWNPTCPGCGHACCEAYFVESML